jgi:hypothetical protein
MDLFNLKAISSKVALDKKFSQFSIDKFELKNGASVIETSLVDALPGLKLEFKGDDQMKGDLSAQYKLPQATLTGEIDIVSFSSLKASLSSSVGPISFGGNGQLENKDGKFGLKDFSLGVGYTVPKTMFVGLKANKKVSDFLANFTYTVNNDVTLAGSITYPKTSVAFGATYKCNPNTNLKFKLGSDGKLGVSAKQSFDKTTSLTAAALVDINNIGAYKVGLTASLG